MWKCAIRTILNLLSTFPLNNPRIAWTILILVQWAITKKAVKILPLFYLVTWKVFTLFILKVTVTVLHNNSPFLRVKNLIFHTKLLFCTHFLLISNLCQVCADTKLWFLFAQPRSRQLCRFSTKSGRSKASCFSARNSVP